MERQNGSALAGLRVLDLGRMIAGPLAAAMLADMGAEVIKVEAPDTGDMARDMLPKDGDVSTYYVVFNRGKRGITLDLKSPEGMEILQKLLAETDVLIENFRPGVMERLNLSYPRVSALNPGIIYASISGYGQTGPYAGRAASDPIAQAMSGLMSVTGPLDGPQVRCGASIADVLAAQNAVIAILAALEYRRSAGVGQQIDIALADSCIAALASVNQLYLTTGKTPRNLGNCFEASAPGNSYPTADGSCVVILSGRDGEWKRLAQVLGHPEWAQRPEFATVARRVENRRKLDSLIASETRRHSRQDLLDLLLAAKLPAAPMLTIDQAAADPHFRHEREMYAQVDHPRLGPVTITGQAVKMSRTNPYVRGCSPELGQHNEEILTALGYDSGEIRRLREKHVI